MGEGWGAYRGRDGGGEVLGDGGRGGEGGLEHGQRRSWAGSSGGEVEGADVESGLDRAAAVRLRAASGGGGEDDGGLGGRR